MPTGGLGAVGVCISSVGVSALSQLRFSTITPFNRSCIARNHDTRSGRVVRCCRYPLPAGAPSAYVRYLVWHRQPLRALTPCPPGCNRICRLRMAVGRDALGDLRLSPPASEI